MKVKRDAAFYQNAPSGKGFVYGTPAIDTTSRTSRVCELLNIVDGSTDLDMIGLLPKITQGDDKDQRIGSRVQFRSLGFRGQLAFQNTKQTVHCWIIKCRFGVNAHSDIPLLFTAYPDIEGVPNFPYPDADGWKEVFGSGKFKVLDHRVWQVGSTKQNVQFNIKLRFKVGKRPVVHYGTDDFPETHQYLMVWYSDIGYVLNTQGCLIEDMTSRATWYDG